MSAYNQLKEEFRQIHAFSHMGAILSWDESVNMPNGSGEARSFAMSEPYAYVNKKLKNPQLKDLLQQAREETSLNDYDHSNIREMQRQVDKANILDETFVKRKVKANMACHLAWREYKEKNNWKELKPLFNEVVEIVKEEASIRSKANNVSRYDALLDLYEPGLNSERIDQLFRPLEEKLPNILQKVLDKQKKEPFKKINGYFSIEDQKSLGVEIMNVLGFDFNRGRLDVSHHPFCGGTPEDVRLTTRYDNEDFTESLMGIVHETGHACYEQGLPQDWLDQPLGQSRGMAVHEGQSLFFEMQIGRDQSFLEFALPLMKKHFKVKENDDIWSLDNLKRVYQHVSRGFIRVDADEVTYPLHVMLRYDLEKELVNDRLKVDDLPEAWDDKLEKLLGLRSKDDYKNGVMQDVHWFSGSIGYFPTYTLGAMVAAQLFSTYISNFPEAKSQFAKGDFSNVTSWLKENIWSKGCHLNLDGLMMESTGSELKADAYLKHIQNRYL